MDVKTEGLQALGGIGIVGEAWRILQHRAKLLGTITLTLILPLCVASVLHAVISIPLLLGILSNEIFIPTGQAVDEEWASRQLRRQLTEFLLVEAAYAVFAFATWTVSTSAVVYTVACFYATKHEPPFGTVMKFASVAWKPLAVTYLWYLITIVGMVVVCGFSCSAVLWASSVVDEVFGVVLTFVGLVTCTVVGVHVGMYARMMWQVGSVVAVLEERCEGWGAMWRGHRLMEGKRVTATWLTVLYLVVQGMYGYSVVSGDWEMATSCAYGTLLVVAECVVLVVWGLSNGVLYFVCKEHQGEGVDEWFLVEGVGDYLPVSNVDVVEGEPKN